MVRNHFQLLLLGTGLVLAGDSNESNAAVASFFFHDFDLILDLFGAHPAVGSAAIRLRILVACLLNSHLADAIDGHGVVFGLGIKILYVITHSFLSIDLAIFRSLLFQLPEHFGVLVHLLWIFGPLSQCLLVFVEVEEHALHL